MHPWMDVISDRCCQQGLMMILCKSSIHERLSLWGSVCHAKRSIGFPLCEQLHEEITSVMAELMQKSRRVDVLEQHVPSSRPHLFQGPWCICFFFLNKTMQNLVLHTLQRQRWGRRDYRLSSPTGNLWWLLKGEENVRWWPCKCCTFRFFLICSWILLCYELRVRTQMQESRKAGATNKKVLYLVQNLSNPNTGRKLGLAAERQQGRNMGSKQEPRPKGR